MNRHETDDTCKVFCKSILSEDELTVVLESEFRGVTTEICKEILNLRERKIREALMQMGWIPPDAQPYWHAERGCWVLGNRSFVLK
jgi:hypothetical protein